MSGPCTVVLLLGDLGLPNDIASHTPDIRTPAQVELHGTYAARSEHRKRNSSSLSSFISSKFC